jgi:hypothetical protein
MLRTFAGEKFFAANIACRIAGGPPALVTCSASITSSATSGSKPSMKTVLEPCAVGSMTNMTTPPMWVSGNWRMLRSSEVGA